MLELDDPKILEEMLEDTGGVRVTIDGVTTVGHRQRADAANLMISERDGPTEAIVLAAGRLPSLPAAGSIITVEDEEFHVLDHVPVEDGALREIAFGAWSHEVATYRPDVGTTERGQQVDAWKPVASRVLLDLREGRTTRRELEDRDRGLDEESMWEAIVPPGTDIQPGDGVKVVGREVAGWPRRFRVTFVGERTALRPTMLELELSRETFT